MKLLLKLVAIIFAIAALLHLLRIIFSVNLVINDYKMPMWVSIIGFIIPAILSVLLWKKSK